MVYRVGTTAIVIVTTSPGRSNILMRLPGATRSGATGAGPGCGGGVDTSSVTYGGGKDGVHACGEEWGQNLMQI